MLGAVDGLFVISTYYAETPAASTYFTESTTLNTSVLDGYLRLVASLSTASKLDLIARLSAAVKGDIAQPENSFAEAFGAFKSEQIAEEIIADC